MSRLITLLICISIKKLKDRCLPITPGNAYPFFHPWQLYPPETPRYSIQQHVICLCIYHQQPLFLLLLQRTTTGNEALHESLDR